ncbi:MULTISPECIES: hypothetical protein [Roseomonadaceae]|uniref:ATP-binding protein n=1 Tax=Falsiroseomonas oleicola TaxID=2801474 RepID=A0ABS6HET9_9PROT|nr:hypothetical protein [Roseomonas oleicola]MBU8547260.1 hypothetical protein [Roseomonas oleicola]
MSDVDTIHIDLDLVGNPSVEPAAPSFIQREARSRVLSALARPIDEPRDGVEDGNRPLTLNVLRGRRHDAILVSARRGEGKTTFLASILNTVQHGDYQKLLTGNSNANSSPPQLYSLGLIDPTLIETKQNIVIVVIDRIRIATEHGRRRSGRSDEYVIVASALRKLAQGLSLLDGIGEGLDATKDWLDPDFVLDRGLEDASAAHDFERRFRDFVRAAARYLDVNAFVLAIDDVDTWFERGWPVLEALRKYLVTPQLRIILSGDLNLYALLVRRQQWGQMGEAFLRAEQMREVAEPGTSLIRKIGSMVEALQDQYLVKVAPPENRIDLKPLSYYDEIGEIQLSAKRLNSPIHLRIFLKRLSDRVLGVRYQPDLELVSRQLLQMPTRSVLQILAGAVDVCGDNQPSNDAFSTAENALRHVAWTALMSVGLDIEKTRNSAPNAIIGVLGEWLTQSKLWTSLARLHPDAVDADNRNLVALYLTAVLNGVFRASPGRSVDYLLRIAVIREKIDRGEIMAAASDGMPRLFAHLAAGTVESSLQFVSRLAAWEVTEGGREGIRRTISQIRLSGASVPLTRVRERNAATKELYGLEYDGKQALPRDLFRGLKDRVESDQAQVLSTLSPPLRGYHASLLKAGWGYDSRRGKEAGFQVYFINGVEDLAERLDRNSGLVARIPMHRIVSGQAAESGNYSFLRLLSTVGELIDVISAPASDRLNQVARILKSSSQVRSYPTPVAAHETRSEDPADFDDEDEVGADKDRDPFASHSGWRVEDILVDWVNEHATRRALRPLAPVTLSRMWTRFTYSFQNMRDELAHGKTRYLGVLMHRTVIAFLHSVGYEALRAANIDTRRSLANNPVTSGAVFARLLDEVYSSEGKAEFLETPEFAFFDLIFSCPLWAYFLARDEAQEVAVPRPQEPNDSIFQHYASRLDSFWQDGDASFAETHLRSPKAENSAVFAGLYFALNTVQLQGQSDQDGRVGTSLAALGRSGVRRRVVRISGNDVDPQS